MTTRYANWREALRASEDLAHKLGMSLDPEPVGGRDDEEPYVEPFEDEPVSLPVVKPRVISSRRVKHTYRDGIETIALVRVRGSRRIRGIASTGTMNSHGYSLDPRGCMISLPVPILSGHSEGPPIGEVVVASKSAERIFIRGVIFEGNAARDYAWRLIKDGTLRRLSGACAPGSSRLAGIVDGKKFYDRWQLGEVSLCRSGANPDCVFEVE